ncbi:hypothetical protein Hbl1158_02415 [Halobaculum sp. CBA1158]|uniref:DUF7576 family protein n=1 Tax=Halobaculum sp. CBA1158 TaxID=2904243 RepID=UPI001F159474|nr:hypothetical protein [Halobaculum sp. CBA1158]UIP00244.1 hypothetical protein Hbl1158_02415 [Halobaculum sp. CBA1158]
MTLKQYLGQPHPDGDATVVRASTHYRWTPGERSLEACPSCGAELTLSERHVLVTLSRPVGGDERRHLCDERCVDAWLADG